MQFVSQLNSAERLLVVGGLTRDVRDHHSATGAPSYDLFQHLGQFTISETPINEIIMKYRNDDYCSLLGTCNCMHI